MLGGWVLIVFWGGWFGGTLRLILGLSAGGRRQAELGGRHSQAELGNDRGGAGVFPSDSLADVGGIPDIFIPLARVGDADGLRRRNENSGMTMLGGILDLSSGGRRQAELGRTHSQAELGNDQLGAKRRFAGGITTL